MGVDPDPERRELGVGDAGEHSGVGVRGRVDAVPVWVAPIFADAPSHSSNVGAPMPASLANWLTVIVTALTASPGLTPVNVPNPDTSSAGEFAVPCAVTVGNAVGAANAAAVTIAFVASVGSGHAIGAGKTAGAAVVPAVAVTAGVPAVRADTAGAAAVFTTTTGYTALVAA